MKESKIVELQKKMTNLLDEKGDWRIIDQKIRDLIEEIIEEIIEDRKEKEKINTELKGVSVNISIGKIEIN